jgi:hypothetical protein
MNFSKIIISFVFIIFIFSGSYYFFNYDDGEILTITPSKEFYKSKPKINENFVHSYTGKAVYENLVSSSGVDKNSKNESLTVQPEKPIEIKTKTNVKEDVFSVSEEDIKENPEFSVFNSLENIMENQGGENSTKKLNVTTISDVDENKISDKESVKDKFYAQLAYSKSKKDINIILERVRADNKFFKTTQHEIFQEMRASGIQYVLLAGPFEDFKAAKLVCTRIKLQNNKCIVLRK